MSLILGQEDPLGEERQLQHFLPGKSHVQMTLAGYWPWGHKESDMTGIHTHKVHVEQICEVCSIFPIVDKDNRWKKIRIGVAGV